MALRSLHLARTIPAIYLACILTTPAFPQQVERPAQNSDRASEAEIGPRGQHMPRNIT